MEECVGVFDYHVKARDLDAFGKLKALTQSIVEASSHIRRLCKNDIASTTIHRLSTCLSFLRAIHANKFEYARRLQQVYPKLLSVSIDKLQRDGSFDKIRCIQDHVVELSQASVQERCQELSRVKQQLPEHIYARRKAGIMRSLKT